MSDMLTKEELKAMDKKDIIKQYLYLAQKLEQTEVKAISDRSTLMKMSSHFLAHMKRPNVNRTAKKGKRPAKFLKWFNSEERYIFLLQLIQLTDFFISRRAFDALVLAEWDAGWGEENDVAIWHMHPDYPNSFDQAEAEEFFHYCLKKFERTRVGVAVVVEDSEVTDAIDADEEDGGDEKLDVKKKMPKEKYHEGDDDDDDETENIPMAKLSVKSTK